MVFIFDSHPVQYKAPVYQRLQQLLPDSFEVIYATDCSVRGHRDAEFGEVMAWDTPLLSGYPHRILNNERGVPLSGFRSLTGRGIYRLLKKEKPDAALLSQFLYQADLTAYLSCLWLGIPMWVRHETQDEAFRRPVWKRWARSSAYRAAYRPVRHAFYIGQLNLEHLLRHGLPASGMSFSPYCVPPPALSVGEKERCRTTIRAQLGVAPGEMLLLFSGKLIEKKNPQLILQALELIPDSLLSRLKVVFVGSGALAAMLGDMAAKWRDRVHFAGFVNQSKIAGYYLAADILILPSRRAGETWGLVVNEALDAGCAVVMTNAVGCHREFGNWERVRVIDEDDARACAWAVGELAEFPRSFDWCATGMENYSVNAAATALARKIESARSSAVRAKARRARGA